LRALDVQAVPAEPARQGALALPRLAMLDLDGTLVDTVPDLAPAVNAAMRELGRPPWPEDRVRGWVGGGMTELLRAALAAGEEGHPGGEAEQVALEVCQEHYASHPCRHSRVYPGVHAGLDYLRARGVRLGCVTNKRSRFTDGVLRGSGLMQHFDVVVSGDTAARMKPHPDPLLHAARLQQCTPTECLMIGDATNDVLAARAAGLPVVCVPYGYDRDVRAAVPDAMVDSLEQLPRLF